MAKRATRRLLKQRERTKYINEIKDRIVCPYCEDITMYSIACESIVKGASSYLKFKKKEMAKEFANKYCCSMEKYSKCPIYCMNTQFMELVRKKRQKEERTRKLDIVN